MYRIRFPLLAAMTAAAAASRLIPHPPNFTPVATLALFAGACFASRRTAFLVPLVAMLSSDLAIGWLSGDPGLGLHLFIPGVYASFGLIVGLGFLVRGRRRILPVTGALVAGSVVFFLGSNLAVWALGSAYPKSWEGLVACYVAAIPFFRNTLLGDACYGLALFGGLAWVEKGIPALREPTVLRRG